MIKKYKSKKVVIEAVQLRSENESFLIDWADLEIVEDYIKDIYGNKVYNPRYFINTLEGNMEAKKGDWIIRGLEGEFYPCKDSVFKAKYEEESDNVVNLFKGQEEGRSITVQGLVEKLLTGITEKSIDREDSVFLVGHNLILQPVASVALPAVKEELLTLGKEGFRLIFVKRNKK